MCLKSLKPKAAILVPFSLSLITSSSASAQQPRDVDFCNYIARIERGSFDGNDGEDFLCDGTLVENPVNLELYCIGSGNTLFLDVTDMVVDLAACERSNYEPSGATLPRVCSLSTAEARCNIPKGPEIEQFTIIQPDTISGTRPQISWEAVDSTDNYLVYVTGHDLSWQREVDGAITSLSYPEDEFALTLGAAYEIGVYANSAESEDYAVARSLINVQETTTLLSIPSTSRRR